MSWVTKEDTLSILKYAVYIHDRWSNSEEIVSGTDWFVNWADFPSLVSGSNGNMAAHYLAKNGEG